MKRTTGIGSNEKLNKANKTDTKNLKIKKRKRCARKDRLQKHSEDV